MTFREMPKHEWTYLAKLVRCVDGDTVICDLDRGMNDYSRRRLRLAGVNTPEIVGADHAAAVAAKEFVEGWFEDVGPSEWPLIVLTEKRPDIWGRYISTIWRRVDGQCLNQSLLDAKLGTAIKPG